jgi:DNA-binding HxlR family transcriptional regulator
MRKASSTNFVNEKSITEKCPITSTMLAIGGRWKLVLIWQIRDKALRYNEIKKAVPNIKEKMLIQQLKALMESGWIEKKDYQEIPPKTEYFLTPLGKSFIPILESIYDWGTEHQIVDR